MAKVKLGPIITERKDGFGNSTIQKMPKRVKGTL
jgi:hypothetical protein